MPEATPSPNLEEILSFQMAPQADSQHGQWAPSIPDFDLVLSRDSDDRITNVQVVFRLTDSAWKEREKRVKESIAIDSEVGNSIYTLEQLAQNVDWAKRKGTPAKFREILEKSVEVTRTTRGSVQELTFTVTVHPDHMLLTTDGRFLRKIENLVVPYRAWDGQTADRWNYQLGSMETTNLSKGGKLRWSGSSPVSFVSKRAK
jgi:hypothetical protein